jgi:hypothetical protein
MRDAYAGTWCRHPVHTEAIYTEVAITKLKEIHTATHPTAKMAVGRSKGQ